MAHRISLYSLFILLLAVMISIFWFSSQPADDSQALSDSLLDRIGKLLSFLPAFEEDPGKNIRKWAHFFEFSCLGFFSFLFMRELKAFNGKRLIRTALFSLLFSFLYAASDEIHQIFVPGRSCRLRDIFIDSMGAAAGTVFALLIIYLLIRKTGRSDHEDTSAREKDH